MVWIYWHISQVLFHALMSLEFSGAHLLTLHFLKSPWNEIFEIVGSFGVCLVLCCCFSSFKLSREQRRWVLRHESCHFAINLLMHKSNYVCLWCNYFWWKFSSSVLKIKIFVGIFVLSNPSVPFFFVNGGFVMRVCHVTIKYFSKPMLDILWETS